MKRLTSILLVLTLIFSAMFMLALPAAADSANIIDTAKYGVVQVYAGIYYEGAQAYTYDGSYSTGTAFGVGKAGEDTDIFITNWHVVTDGNGKVYDKVYLALDKANVSKGYNMVECKVLYTTNHYPDFAIIQAVNPISGVKALPLMPAENAKVGDKIYVLGYPGVTNKIDHVIDNTVNDLTVTDGIVSRFIEFSNTETNCIVHTADANHGNSGGPVITENGAVIGIHTYRSVNQADTRNMAVYIDYPMEILDVYKIPYDVYEPGANQSEAAAEETNLNDTADQQQEETTKNNTPVIIGVAVAVAAIAAAAVVVLKKKGNGGAKVTLKAVSGPLAGKTFPITQSGVIIGRDAGAANVVVPNDQTKVSRKHCKVECQNGKILVTDLASTHGTAVNGKKLPANVALTVEQGASIELCDSDNRFVIL